MEDLTFTCPVCGADVPRRAKACPECGACDKSGWRQDQYPGGLDLPGENFNYDDFVRRELEGRSPKKTKVQWLWLIVAILIVIGLAWMTMRGM